MTMLIHLMTLANDNLLAFIGFICVDNTLLQGQVYLPAEKRAKNEKRQRLFPILASIPANSRRLDNHICEWRKAWKQRKDRICLSF